MATVAQRRYTADDLLKLEIAPTPELVNGRLVRRTPLGQHADAVGMRLGGRLLAFSETVLPGIVNGSEGGFQIFPDDPDKVRFPDVSFTRLDRLPDGQDAAGHCKVRPEFVAEIVSPNDRVDKLRLKIQDYIAAEIPVILIVYPVTREIELIRADGSHTFLKVGDTIDGGDALPGFACPVASLFLPTRKP